MFFKVHRGTKEIGGSCVEVWSENARIIIDIGMPLVDSDGSEFDFNKYKSLSVDELIGKKVLPDIKGFYDNANKLIDGVLISHAHIDHYGFSRFLHPEIHYYMGEATHKLIKLGNLFMPWQKVSKQDNIINNTYFEHKKPFNIGDIKITPYLMDHAAFDAHAFLIEADGKSLFYSGDFRSHGRKGPMFEQFIDHPPLNVDYLLLEGTQMKRNDYKEKTEKDVEEELVDKFSERGKINLIYTSGQNIDRLVSIYRACKRTGKLFVVDVYVASILKELSNYGKIPFPSSKYLEVKVIFPNAVTKILNEKGQKKQFYQFKAFKITRDEISANKDNIVLIVRPSMKKDLEKIQNVDGGNLIYSMWEGYMEKNRTKKFINYLTEKRKFSLDIIHTSGHADIDTLQRMVDALEPKFIVPIHTFYGNEYKKHFNQVLEINDGVEVKI